jgi:hypothetical protein
MELDGALWGVQANRFGNGSIHNFGIFVELSSKVLITLTEGGLS